jgi:hypothetical protein
MKVKSNGTVKAIKARVIKYSKKPEKRQAGTRNQDQTN